MDESFSLLNLSTPWALFPFEILSSKTIKYSKMTFSSKKVWFLIFCSGSKVPLCSRQRHDFSVENGLSGSRLRPQICFCGIWRRKLRFEVSGCLYLVRRNQLPAASCSFTHLPELFDAVRNRQQTHAEAPSQPCGFTSPALICRCSRKCRAEPVLTGSASAAPTAASCSGPAPTTR